MSRFRKVMGIEDGSFIPRISKHCLLAGVLMSHFKVEDVFLERITVDGMDVTDKVLKMLRKARNVELLVSGGITFAGFNILDPYKVFKRTQVPVLIITRRKPNNEAVYSALRKHFKDWKERWEIIRQVGNAMEIINIKSERMYIELVGLTYEDAVETIESLTIWGKRPEPLRVANLVAKGLSKNLTEI